MKQEFLKWLAVPLASAGVMLLASCSGDSAIPFVMQVTLPSQVYGEQFDAVQTAQIFPGRKTFVDVAPNIDPAAIIIRLYQRQKCLPGFLLQAFVDQSFTLSLDQSMMPPNHTLDGHFHWLWPKLIHTMREGPSNSSLIALPKPGMVRGGHSREGCYWDTCFTMLGLQEAGRGDFVDSVFDDFAHRIDTIGHVPNNSCTYFVSCVQPPFFGNMVSLAALGCAAYRTYLMAWRKEHAYWMQIAHKEPSGAATGRVVAMPDGSVLQRYWDASDTPREKSCVENRQTARQGRGQPVAAVWRDLRVAAESGWEFSSRCFCDNTTLATIHTVSIVFVDLDGLIFNLETTIAKQCLVVIDLACITEFTQRVARREAAINRYLWNPNDYYGDYDWQHGLRRDNLSAAALYPLFTGVAQPAPAMRAARQVGQRLLQPDELATITHRTGKPWDAPNG